MSDLVDEFTAQLTAATPYIGVIIGGVLGLVALVALGGFAIRRVRGAIK